MNSSHSQSAKSTAAPSLENSGSRIYNAQQALDFEAEALPGSFNDDLLVRAALSSSIRHCELSREQIADEMTGLLGTRVTAKMINTYTAESTALNRLPAGWARAFCRAVGSDDLLRAMAEAAGFRLISKEEIELLELGRQYLVRKRADEQARLLEERLRGVQL